MSAAVPAVLWALTAALLAVIAVLGYVVRDVLKQARRTQDQLLQIAVADPVRATAAAQLAEAEPARPSKPRADGVAFDDIADERDALLDLLENDVRGNGTP